MSTPPNAQNLPEPLSMTAVLRIPTMRRLWYQPDQLLPDPGVNQRGLQLFGPAQGVTIRSIVPLNGLRSANALIQQVMFGMRIIGPAMAALVVASFGAHTCYIADSISFLTSGYLISTLRIVRPPASILPASRSDSPTKRDVGSVLTDMRAGIQFIVHHAAYSS